MTPTILLAVFIGGGTGATCRHCVNRLIGSLYNGPLPLATLCINVSGCFALGIFMGVLPSLSETPLLTALLATGFLGGYTTFSTYALEGALLYRESKGRCALLLIGSLIAGLGAAALGALVGRLA